MASFLAWLQTIDRRIMYTLLIVLVAWPLIRPLGMPIPITPQVLGVYKAVEAIPKNKVAIVSVNWDAGTSGENEWQTRAIVRHLMRHGTRIIFVAMNAPQGSEFAQQIGESIGKEYHKVYGTDWVNVGFRPNMDNVVMAMRLDIPGTLKTDRDLRPLSEFPIMRRVKTIKHDVGLIVETTGSATLASWISFVQGVDKVPLAYCPTAVMLAEGYNPLDAHQIVGMLPGLKGAGEYEELLKRPDFGYRGAGALSTSHMLIIVLIILGNVGYVVVGRRAAPHSEGT
jgi:hypothetical protein